MLSNLIRILIVASLQLQVLEGQIISASSTAKDIYSYIHQNQNPHPSQCQSRRLLVVHSDGKHFEGTGSILKLVILGLAEAIHSNRTLVWGRFVPELFYRAKAKKCYDNMSGGLYGCFFKALSTCSFDDVTPAEKLGLGVNGYNHSERVALQQPRRGLAAYIPTRNLRGLYGAKVMWPAMLARYAFRLKVRLPTLPGAKPMRCAHVRHGDIRSLSYVYQNKQVFEFDEYLTALARIPGPPPKTVFFATDSTEVEDELPRMGALWKELHSFAQDKESCDAEEENALPSFVTTDRFRSQFGSHVFAARGGCMVGAGCAVPYNHLNTIRREVEDSHESDDVYDVVLESIEDLYILSHCDAIVGSGSSHMSTVAIFLSWARKSNESLDLSKFVLLDKAGIANGQVESSFLLGTYKAQSFIPVSNGYERYANLQMRFGDTELVPTNHPDLHADETYFDMPTMSYTRFDNEVDTWTANELKHNDCNEHTDLESLINNGVDHSTWHPNIALHCWQLAMDIINETPSLDKFVEEVVTENILAIREKHFSQYIQQLF